MAGASCWAVTSARAAAIASGKGWSVAQLARKHGISAATYYHWKSKYAGAGVPELKRLRELEGENAKLKKLLAEAHLDIDALKSVFKVKT